jgi:hypothetical protein
MIEKIFFFETKDEIDYNKRSKTMPMPVSFKKSENLYRYPVPGVRY